MRTLPAPLALTRTGSRAARVGAFTLEVWSRLLVEGPHMGVEERAQLLSWTAENMCALHGVRLTVRGRVPQAPSMLVANHVSYFDPLIVASQVPCTAIAKREVSAWPCIGDVTRRLGALFVTRTDALSGARVLRDAIRALRAGVSVLVFPEGTTTHGDKVLPFKRGAFGAAAIAGVPIVPVAIKYGCAHAAWVGDDTFLPHYVRTMAKPYTRVHLEFLEPLPYARAGSVAELAEQARSAIEHTLTSASHDGALRVPRFDDVWSVATA